MKGPDRFNKRRQSSVGSEELFEFVDFTSVSNFERLITAIEEILQSWGAKDGQFGIFSNDTLLAHNTTRHLGGAEYTRQELLSIGDETFRLSFHCHPRATRRDTTDAYDLGDFYLLGDNNKMYHTLHRSTGFDRLFLLVPVVDSLKAKLFSPSQVDLSRAKTLLSACAIAFQNVKCTVPVFVPVGQARHGMYTGYMLPSGAHMELRFNTAIMSPVSPPYTSLDGLQSLFLQKLTSVQDAHGIADATDVRAAAVFTYDLKNWYDERWKGEQTTVLPYGSYNDPLRSLTLSAIFPMASLSDYADGLNETDMDALTAQHWRLGVELAPYSQQRCFLSSLLDTMLTSWIRDPANRDYLPPYDASNREEHKETNPGLMRNLFHAIGPRPPTMQPSPAPSIVPDQMEQIMQTLFTPMDATEQQHLPSPLYSPAALGYRLKHGSPVPVQSFLYLFMQQILLVSDNSKSSMVMLKMVWMEAVRRIRWHWDNHVEIPNVDVSLYGRKGLKDSSETLRQHDYESVEGIDLRYNILHQKLTMLNCCIHRRAREGERPQKGRTDYVSSLFDDIGSPSKSKMDRFNTFVERLVEGDQEDIKEDDEDQKNDETEDNGEEIKSIASSSEGDIFFDSMEDIGDESRNNRASSQRSQSDKQPQRPPQKPWSRTSSLSDVSEVAHPHSMTESFVRLNYPSSAESYPPPAKPYRAEDFVDEDAAAEVKDPEVSEGRLRPHEDLTLLETGEPLFIPVTQESGFMTEDMISQQADVFEKMGTSEDAAQSRAKMQSRHLRSDMEAFKAANPHATLEDFVRWHSPRDWVESARKEDEEGERGEGEQVRGAGGHLSARMTAPGNLWLEIWKNARRIPVCRQKPLFDARTEGEKALHFLETLSVHEVFAMLLPTLALVAYDTLSSNDVTREIPAVARGLAQLAETLIHFPWDQLRSGKCTVEPVLMNIREQESLICNAISLLHKLPEQPGLVERLMLETETDVHEGGERDAVFQLFRSQRDLSANPSSREYVLYGECKLENRHGLPVRQYALIRDSELRVVDLTSTQAE